MRNYSIFMRGNEVFGYWECDDLQSTLEYLSRSSVNRRWQEHMGDIIVRRDDFPGNYDEVFHMD